MPARRLLLFLCFACLFVCCLAADPPAFRVVREGGVDQMNPIDAQLRRGMDWRHGAFTVVDGIGGGSPVFYSLDREGKLTDTAAFRNPEPTRMYHFSYDRQTDGTIVFSGQTETVPPSRISLPGLDLG
jgi:hypothetical protein